MKKVHLEGSLEVELKDGRHRIVTGEPFNGKVRHTEASVAFGLAELTNEDVFREQIKRVVSRSRYDSR